MKKAWSKQEAAGLKADARKHIISHFASNEDLDKETRVFVRGDGCYLYDVDGRRYLDTFASLLTTVCGHRRPEVDAAIREQLDSLEFFPNYVDAFTPPLVALAKKLAAICPGDLCASFFVNSGSEANETAFKMARQYHWEKGEKGRTKVFFRRFSYHGTTLGGCSATGIPWFREYFEPFLIPSFLPTFSTRCHACELGLEPKSCGLQCLKMMEKQMLWEDPRTIAALIMDPLPGSNTGYPVPPDGYLQGVRELCDNHGILLIFDEVQTGFGKTGKMFACEHWGVTPDILTIGKGFSGGYVPLAAAVTTDTIASAFRKPGHEFRSGSTYGGHTIACAATLANIEVIEKNALAANAVAMGARLFDGLSALQGRHRTAGVVSGMGLLRALFLVADNRTGKPLDPSLGVGNFVRDYCHQNGMILRNNGDILVLAPALIITREQVDEVVTVLDHALDAAEKRFAL